MPTYTNIQISLLLIFIHAQITLLSTSEYIRTCNLVKDQDLESSVLKSR